MNKKDNLQGWLLIIFVMCISAVCTFLGIGLWLSVLISVLSVLLLGGIYGVLKSKVHEKHASESQDGAIYAVFEDKNNNTKLVKFDINDYPADIPAYLACALEAEAQGDFLKARVSYMQATEILKNRCSKNEYKQYMSSLQKMYDEFVLRDPYYKELMYRLLQIIEKNNGILQSDITKDFQHADWGKLQQYNRSTLKDDIYYALYFAERFGHVVRIKKGNSYLLYLPGTEPKHKIATNHDNKIDIGKYSPLTFSTLANDYEKKASEAYKQEDYISYINYKLKRYYYLHCGAAFSTMIPCDDLNIFEDTLKKNVFPNSGTSRDFQSFKKLGIHDIVPTMNEAFIEFMSNYKQDLFKIKSMMNDYYHKWENMTSFDRVKFVEELEAHFTAEYIGSIDQYYFIYENSFLHQKFEQYETGEDYNSWWQSTAIKIINNALKNVKN
jgi:hypothetical protein|nr:MAG TPA: hypothetical protein [Caudoviricetes sp.]